MNHLPLLEETLADIPDGFFENTLLIGCQHLLPTVLDLIYGAISKGLEPGNIFLIGKCYSTSHAVVDELKKTGVVVCDSSDKYDSHQSYETLFANNCTNFLKKTLENIDLSKFRRIIILDDGGQLHIAFNQLMPNNEKVIGIEQTSKGANILRSVSLKYPIVNVARSAPKLTLESPVIADIIIKNIAPYLNKNPKLLIIGNGSIGNSVYHKLKKIIENILLLDKDPQRNIATKEEIMDKKDQDYFIIGATGENILPELNKYNLLENKVTLASTSSLDIEFNAIEFRRKVKKNYNCHENIILNNITLLNSGFPVNFSGIPSDFVPRKQFQLVNSLILSSMKVEKKNKPNKLIPMDKNIQKLYAERYIASMDVALEINEA